MLLFSTKQQYHHVGYNIVTYIMLKRWYWCWNWILKIDWMYANVCRNFMLIYSFYSNKSSLVSFSILQNMHLLFLLLRVVFLYYFQSFYTKRGTCVKNYLNSSEKYYLNFQNLSKQDQFLRWFTIFTNTMIKQF